MVLVAHSTSQQTVLITGCSSGIGRELAREFHKQGYKVFATARSVSKLIDLKNEGISTLQLDVTDSKSIEAAVDEVLKLTGKIDILVNNAGITSNIPAAEVSLQEIRDVFETNFFGLIALTQLVLKKSMFPSRSGKIVQISSMAGEICTPWNSAYSASKAAVTLYSDGLRLETAPFGIDVIIVKPGGIKSDIANNAADKLSKAAEGSVYAPIWEFVKKRGTASQQNPMPAETFAEHVVSRVRKAHPPSIIIAGTSSTLMWILSFAPAWFSDFFLARTFGLTKLKFYLQSEKKSS